MERHLAGSLAVCAVLALGASAACHARTDFLGIDETAPAARSVGTLDGATRFSYSGTPATGDTTDRAVAGRVVDALAGEPALEGAAITVLIEQGRVRLAGTTRDEDQAAYALEVARDAAGPAVDVAADDLHAGEARGTAG